MTLADFITSLSLEAPPQGLTSYSRALWWDGKGNWQKAHDIIEDLGDDTAAWVHAYLHRKEGDNGNARYWYARAGRKMPEIPLKEEWEAMVKALNSERPEKNV
jgi:hypothetical protein